MDFKSEIKKSMFKVEDMCLQVIVCIWTKEINVLSLILKAVYTQHSVRATYTAELLKSSG